MQNTHTVIVGAGQAGLAISHELTQHNVDHVILERGQIGQSWRDRWDSFCLVTPNWSVQLPGYPYDGDDPDGFMPRDQIVAYLERYAAHFAAPIKSGTSIQKIEGGGNSFTVSTDHGDYAAQNLVLATGAFQKPNRPVGAASLPDHLKQIGLEDYTSADTLPDGDILIIGSGQSGCQIAEELVEAGRNVTLACGRAPWIQRRIGGKDIVWWLVQSGFLEAKTVELPKEARLFANILATGHHGGHDLSLPILHNMGVTLVGRFLNAEGNTAHFADDLAQSISWGNDRYLQLRDVVTATAEKLGLSNPDMPDPLPFTDAVPTEVDLSSFGTVFHTGGFRPDFTSWLPWEDAFDDGGFPIHDDGSSTVVNGLHFIGIHFLRTRQSSILHGVGNDAKVIAARIAG